MAKKNKALVLIANVISRVFGHLTMVYLVIVAFLSDKVPAEDLVWVVLGSMVIISSGVVLYVLSRLGIVSDYDLTKREERPLFLLFLVFLGLVILFFYVVFDVSIFLRYVVLIFITEMILDFLITLFWKISNHAIVITTFVLMVIILLGRNYLFLSVLIPIVWWARWYLEKHSLLQLIAGTTLSGLIIFTLSTLFGFI